MKNTVLKNILALSLLVTLVAPAVFSSLETPVAHAQTGSIAPPLFGVTGGVLTYKDSTGVVEKYVMLDTERVYLNDRAIGETWQLRFAVLSTDGWVPGEEVPLDSDGTFTLTTPTGTYKMFVDTFDNGFDIWQDISIIVLEDGRYVQKDFDIWYYSIGGGLPEDYGENPPPGGGGTSPDPNVPIPDTTDWNADTTKKGFSISASIYSGGTTEQTTVTIVASPAEYGGETPYSKEPVPVGTKITFTAPKSVTSSTGVVQNFVSWYGCETTDAATQTCTFTTGTYGVYGLGALQVAYGENSPLAANGSAFVPENVKSDYGEGSSSMLGAAGSVLLTGLVGMAVCYLTPWITGLFVMLTGVPWLFAPTVSVRIAGATASDLLANGAALGANTAAGFGAIDPAMVPVTAPYTQAQLAAMSGQLAVISLNTLNTSMAVNDAQLQTERDTFQQCIFDPLVNMLKQYIIRAITDSIIAWIKGGFKGTPSFIEDPMGFFTGVAENAVSAYLAKAGLDKILCEPFRIDLILNIGWDFNMPTKHTDSWKHGGLSCSLDKIFPGVDITVGAKTQKGLNGSQAYAEVVQKGNIDFPGGGFGAAMGVFRDENNPIGSTFNVQSDATRFMNTQTQRESTLLGYGKGWLSTRCDADKDPKTPESVCTPGEYVAEQVNRVSNSTLSELEIADEFAEVINALLEVLIETIVNGVNSTLLEVSYRR